MSDFPSKIKQLFFSGVLSLAKFFAKLMVLFKSSIIIIAKPLFLLFKKVFGHIFLPVYKLLRKIKKISLALPLWLKDKTGSWIWHYSPLLILVIIGLVIFASNLQAQEIKPDKYGQKSLLYKMVLTGENFSLTLNGETLEEDAVLEGPLNKQLAPISYLRDEAISSAGEEPSQVEQGIDTLVSATGDESVLISPEITDPEVVVKERDKVVEYQVQPGDVLSTIADKFGLKVNTILWENNLGYYSVIKPGQTLRILPVDGLTYKVKSSDTLNKIAKEYKSDVNAIIEFNKLASAVDIQTGNILILPGGIKAQAPAPSVVYSLKSIFSAPAAASSSKLQWPTTAYRMTQYYTWRHHGVDIGNKSGQPIYAAEAGTVRQAGWNNGGYGNMIIIDHGGGLETLYGHASKLYVKVGDKVTRGQVIAGVGSTGRSTGPHLHFEVRVNGARLNPLGYIK